MSDSLASFTKRGKFIIMTNDRREYVPSVCPVSGQHHRYICTFSPTRRSLSLPLLMPRSALFMKLKFTHYPHDHAVRDDTLANALPGHAPSVCCLWATKQVCTIVLHCPALIIHHVRCRTFSKSCVH